MLSTLYLASSSASRKQLLHDSKIPFVCIRQEADETVCDHTLPLEQLVAAIARHKMDHIIMPVGSYEGEGAFVLTADTLGMNSAGTIRGKPRDRAEAVAMIRSSRDESRLSTAFCLEKRIYNGDRWHVVGSLERVVSATYRFAIPDGLIDYYLDNAPALHASGAVTIEGLGQQFLEKVNGSYSAIIGLPMYELREALQELNFFE